MEPSLTGPGGRNSGPPAPSPPPGGDPAGRVREAFIDLTGAEPEGVWSAPGRVNLIGEHTDHNDGCVLPFAIGLRTAAAVRRRQDGWLRAVTLQTDQPELEIPVAALVPGAVTGWGAYVAGVVWALRSGGFDVGSGADVVVDGTVPPGSGLSSSAALECAVTLALTELADGPVAEDGASGPEDLARLAQRAENDFVGVPCGLMDQMVAMTATAGHALFLDVRSGATEQIPLDPERSGMALLVIDTHVRHSLADGAYRDRRNACSEAAGRLGLPNLRELEPAQMDRALRALAGEPALARRVRHVVTEQARTVEAAHLLRSGRLTDIGPLLDASHRSLRDDFEVSTPELDAVVEAARAAGAVGARLTGGGFGGCAIALVPDPSVPAVAEAASRAVGGRAGAGTGVTVLPVTPGPGARRDQPPVGR